MTLLRCAVVVLVVAPGLAVLMVLAGLPVVTGVLVGVAAGFLLRGEPARAAISTLLGSTVALLVGVLADDLLVLSDHSDFADRLASPQGWPGWAAGGVLAYLIAAGGLPGLSRRTAGRPDALEASDSVPPAGVFPVIAAAVGGAVLGCGLLVAARSLGWTLWTEYDYYDGPGWYRDLSKTLWLCAAAVVIASVVADALPGRRGRFVELPLAAWLGCAATAGPLQYALALNAPDEPAAVAVLACLAGGGTGAAAAAAGLRHAGTKAGLVVFVLAVTAGLDMVVRAWYPLAKELHVGGAGLGLRVPVIVVILVGAVAAWTAYRDGSVGSGVVAGMAGPLLVWSAFVPVGSRAYDHTSQAEPYYDAWLMVPVALLVALPVALVAAGLARAVSPSSSVRR